MAIPGTTLCISRHLELTELLLSTLSVPHSIKFHLKTLAVQIHDEADASLFSSPVGSLCHTRGVVRRPSFVVRRTSCVVCVHQE